MRKYRTNDFEKVSNLIRNVYTKQLAPLNSKNANKIFLNYLIASKKSFGKAKLSLIIEENGKIIGVLKGKILSKSTLKVSTLFIAIRYQKKGFGSKLLKKVENNARKIGIQKIILKANPKAVNFYRKLGYEKTTGIRILKTLGNLKIQPMAKTLKKQRTKP